MVNATNTYKSLVMPRRPLHEKKAKANFHRSVKLWRESPCRSHKKRRERTALRTIKYRKVGWEGRKEGKTGDGQTVHPCAPCCIIVPVVFAIVDFECRVSSVE